MAGEAGVREIRAVVSANAAMKGRVTRRTPQRSTILPTKGVASAPSVCETVTAEATVPRFQPNSATIGFRKTPNVNRVMGPLPTIKPIVEPNTTHHGFLKVRPGLMLPSPASFPKRDKGLSLKRLG